MRRTLFIIGLGLLLVGCNRDPYKVENPDPNHTHADFAVWIDGVQLDLSDPKYMSGVSYDDASHDEEHEYLHEYLHLHDEVGHVVHRHKPGLTLGEFFASLGIEFQENTEWSMFVNGEEIEWNLDFVFQDLDQILLTNSQQPEAIQLQLDKLTDDACLYSRRCPWRGDPPDENCIADPSIPCVVPESEL